MSKRLLRASQLLPYGLIIAAWWYFGVFAEIPYWQVTGDYSWHAMSHAFTLESIYSHSPAVNIGYGVHPGLPFGFLSWVAYRLTALGIPTPSERIAYVVNHGEAFWLYAKSIALLLNLAGIYALQKGARGNALLFWISFLIYFSMLPATFGSALVQLTNESSALLFVVVAYISVGRPYFAAMMSSPPQSVATRGLTTADGLSFAIGALAAVGWSIKIYYLAPPFGLAFGMLVACILGSIPWSSMARSAVAALIGFIIPFATMVTLTMGWRSLTAWAEWNWSMLTHVGNYGSGASGFIDVGNMAGAAEELMTSTDLRFPIIFAAIIIAALIVVAKLGKDRLWRAENLPLLLAIALGLAINVLGLLKHYSPRYALPVCATLSCLVLLLDRYLTPRIMAISASLGAILAAVNLAAFASAHVANLKVAHEVREDEQQITHLPLAPGEKRVWAYYSPVEAGELPIIVRFSGSTLAAKSVFPTGQSNDVAPNSDPSAKDWKYVIFPKAAFRTPSAILATYRDRFDFAESEFRINSEDKITELKQFFVLTIQNTASHE